ncbi:MAG: Cardiolipin synthase C [Elusimicrobia bacterium]|nr:Cardiolipin synthase C [Elusimicrobiota bacterium]
MKERRPSMPFVCRWSTIVFFFFAGCATLPKDFNATPSTAPSREEKTTLREIFKPDSEAHPGQSGFVLLNTGRDAFLSRIALTETAERGIDAQYFIWNGDRCGTILMQRLVKAADRGVRVRLLLDDLTTHGKDLAMVALNQHPNIEIRLFNPLGRRYYLGLFRTMSLAFHAGRMTNRMHNKIFAVDNQIAILGGRNIGDEYFGLDKRSNFRDMDLLIIGKDVGDISSAFDGYWNSPWSIPYEVYKKKVLSDKSLKKKMEKLEKEFVQKEKNFPYPLDWSREAVLKILGDNRSAFVWGKSEVVCDPPDKAWKKAKRGESKSEVLNTLIDVGQAAKKDMLIISPYLIISDEAVKKFGQTVQRGVSVRILTNSLKSTDAVPVVAMYRTFRKDLMKQGPQLYEMRPDAGSRALYSLDPMMKKRMSLHAKAVVYDQETVFIGTFNIDPRSEYLNTEVGLLVYSPEFAKKVTEAIQFDLLPENSYRLRVTPKGKDVEWVCVEKGKEKIYSTDPHAGPWIRFEAWFLSLLPIKNQL